MHPITARLLNRNPSGNLRLWKTHPLHCIIVITQRSGRPGMDLLDYATKCLGILSTLIAIWLGYLNIRELNRKRSLRSGITIRSGQIVEHRFSLSHNWQIWLTAAALLVGLSLIGKGLYESYNLMLILGSSFILVGLTSTYAISRSRHKAEEQRLTWYAENRARFQHKKKQKRRKAPSDKVS
jgi:hypothetical protein